MQISNARGMYKDVEGCALISPLFSSSFEYMFEKIVNKPRVMDGIHV